MINEINWILCNIENILVSLFDLTNFSSEMIFCEIEIEIFT